MPTTKMANAADLVPLAAHLEEEAGYKSKFRVFSARNVPLDILDHIDAHLPYSDVCALYENAARYIGDEFFGARCGLLWGIEHLGPLGQYAITGSNLRGGLQKLISAVSFYESGSHGSLESHGGLTKFSYFTGFGHPVGRNHYADAHIGVMLDFVRHYTGPDWLPVRIGTDNNRCRSTFLLEDFFEVPIDFGQPALSLTFSSSDLETPNPSLASANAAMTLSDVRTLLGGARSNSTVASVTEIVRMRLLGGLTDIEGAARHLRIGVRTLQRQLSVEGASYRTIVATERYRRALDLLSETRLSVTEIAVSLGYAYPSDFTRSFARHHGQPPTRIRSANSIPA